MKGAHDPDHKVMGGPTNAASFNVGERAMFHTSQFCEGSLGQARKFSRLAQRHCVGHFRQQYGLPTTLSRTEIRILPTLYRSNVYGIALVISVWQNQFHSAWRDENPTIRRICSFGKWSAATAPRAL